MRTKLERFLSAPECRTPPDAKLRAAFTLPSGEVGEIASHVMDAIDKVHGGGNLPVIAIEKSVAKVRYAAMYQFLPATKRARRILLSLYNESPSFALCHEIGHFMDEQGWDAPGFASANLPNRHYDRWFTCVLRSEAIRNLLRIGRHRFMDVLLPEGGYIERPTNRNYIGYFLTSEEMWARCYAQYVAVKSQDPLLLHELGVERDLERGKPYYPKQWTNDDFAPILEAIEEIFRERGRLT